MTTLDAMDAEGLKMAPACQGKSELFLPEFASRPANGLLTPVPNTPSSLC